jgi:hypothetical protein
VKKRQLKVNRDYHKRARKPDEELGTAAGSTGPFKQELNQYGQQGQVPGSVVGLRRDPPLHLRMLSLQKAGAM